MAEIRFSSDQKEARTIARGKTEWTRKGCLGDGSQHLGYMQGRMFVGAVRRDKNKKMRGEHLTLPPPAHAGQREVRTE